MATTLKVNELKRDANKNIPDFISTYLANTHIFRQICKDARNLFGIFQAMIRHKNVQVISYIVETNKCDIDYLRKFNNEIPGHVGFYELLKPLIDNSEHEDNNEIIQLMWKFYDYSLPSSIFDPEHHEFEIIKNYIYTTKKLDDITQKNLLVDLLKNIASHNKSSYIDIIINDFNMGTFITENIKVIIMYALEYPNIFFHLVDITKYDFSDYTKSICVMFFFIGKIKSLSKYSVSVKDKKYIDYKDRIIQTIEKILYIHKSKFIQETPDETIYDFMEKYDVPFDSSNLTTTFIMMNILSTQNKELFEIGLKNKFMDTNIPKWYRNIILYSNLENYIRYSQTYPIEPIEDMRTILNIVWKKNYYKLRDTEEKNYIRVDGSHEFFYYYIENYNSDIFAIEPDDYEYVVDFMLSKHDRGDTVLSMKEYYEIIEIRPELANDDFMFEYAQRNSYDYVFSESRGWDEMMIDKFYQKYLEENIGFETCIENIDTIFQRHPNLDEYTNIEKIIIGVLENGTLKSIQKITKFFASHEIIKQKIHIIFKKVFEVGKRIFHFDDVVSCINYVIPWINSYIEPGYYQVFVGEYNTMIGYRCGNVITGMSS